MSEFTEVIVSDTETTGFDPNEGAALLEVAAVSALSRDIGWWSFVEFEGEIPPEAKAVHHILENDVAPGSSDRVLPREKAVDRLLGFEHPKMVWAFHHAAFDLQFLPELKQPVICTYRCALHIYPDAPAHKNQVLRYWLGVEPDSALVAGLDAHRAQYDSAVTAAILRRMLETNTIEELVALTSKPVLLTAPLRFGKHKGMSWQNCPRDYVQWALYKSDMADNPDVKYTLEVRLGLRDIE